MTPTLRLLRPLGQGGMGRVWTAHHETLDTDVVVKFMATDVAATVDGATRFAREAAVGAAVKSPHVVQVFDHGITPDGEAYIVMELLEGRDLAGHLAANGPMAPRDVAALVAQVAKALGKAHQVGVIHRDIKPDNIFLCDADGGELFVKVLDFGIAKREQYRVHDAATTTGAVVGTPYYMSPEQIIGDKDIDARTDIWSLGVVAFEAMTGTRPFDGTTVGAITLAIHTGTRRISDHLADAPAALDEWFARVCARDVKARFQTAREAANALLQATGGLSGAAALVRVPQPSLVDSDPSVWQVPGSAPSDQRASTSLSSAFPVPSIPRPRRRRTLIGGAVALIVVLGVLALAVPALLGSRSRPAREAASLGQTPVAPIADAPPVPPTSSEVTSAPVAWPVASAVVASPTASAAPAAASNEAQAPRATPPPATATAVTRTTPRKPKATRTRDDDDIK